MHALWGLTMSLRAPKVPSAWECRPAPAEAVAYSRRQARFSIRRRTACRRCPIRSHIPNIIARREAQRYFSFIHRVCVPSQQSILRSLRNVIRNSRTGTPFGRGNRALLVLGTCQMLLRDGKLPLVFQGTAAKPVARRIPARSRHCRPNRTAGEWWKVVKFPTGAEGKRLQISRGVIPFLLV